MPARVGRAGAGWWQRDYIHAGRLLASIAPGNEGLRHYHLDYLGSTRAVSNAAGTIVTRHTYLPFGQEITDPAQSGAGRFLGIDPVLGQVEVPQSWNRYVYVRGNPMGYLGPTGRRQWVERQRDQAFREYLAGKISHDELTVRVGGDPSGQKVGMFIGGTVDEAASIFTRVYTVLEERGASCKPI